eukprot:13311167-Alexandrium_andersonii.AAC.1
MYGVSSFNSPSGDAFGSGREPSGGADEQVLGAAGGFGRCTFDRDAEAPDCRFKGLACISGDT